MPSRRRLFIVAGVLFFLLSLLVVQFFTIQIIQKEKWQRVAERQHYFEIREPFVRGTFYSNPTVKRGHPEEAEKLAIDVFKYHLYIDPLAIPKTLRREIQANISSKVRLTTKEVGDLHRHFEKKSHSRRIASWISEEEKGALLSWWRPFARKQKLEPNALFFVGDAKRSHPFGKMLGQVLHTVQEQKDDRTMRAFPTGGLELSLDGYLQGTVGKRRLMRSPRHSLMTEGIIESPVHGCDIYLTINHCLQAICEEEIEKGVKNCRAKSGWAVMMHPKTGEILALAQYPSFSPDEYRSYFNSKERIEETKVKAITDAHEPGSVMKPFSLAIAMKANKILRAQGKKALFLPEEKIDTSSGRFPGRSKPMTDTHFHHYLNMKLGMQKSSNIYFARLIQRTTDALGDAWYREQLVNCGFHTKTGIELPGESWGLLPRQGKNHPNGRPEWSTPTPFSLAIGYNLQVTSVQLVRAFALFANGGILVEPTLIRKIVRRHDDGSQEIVVDHTPPERVQQFPRVLDEDIVKEVVRVMKLVTKRGGTARRADIYGYTEAGKTSTDMKLVNGAYSSKKHVASFVGFAPVSNPAFVLMVTMDEPEAVYEAGRGFNHHGGLAAAPVFREIGKRTLEYLGVLPDDPFGYPAGDPRRMAEKADMIGEAEALEKLYAEWNGAH